MSQYRSVALPLAFRVRLLSLVQLPSPVQLPSLALQLSRLLLQWQLVAQLIQPAHLLQLRILPTKALTRVKELFSFKI